MKNIQYLFSGVLVLCLFVGHSFGGTVRVDLGLEDVLVINESESGARILILDLSSLPAPEGVRVLSAYLYLDISADRLPNSEHPEELLTIGISPCTAQGSIDEEFLVAEYTLLPGAQNSVVLDITSLVLNRDIEWSSSSWVAVYGRDEKDEKYLLGLPREAGFSGRVELRYSR